jgi:hypothetical protein
VGYPVKIRTRKWFLKTQTEIVYKGALHLWSSGGEEYVFATRVSEFSAVEAFLRQTVELQDQLTIERSPVPLGEDSPLARQLDLLGD